MKLFNLVELDEAYVPVGNKGKRVEKPRKRGGGRKRGRARERKLPVISARERGSKRVLFKCLESVSSKQVEKFLLEHVTLNSTVFTDEFRSYRVVSSLGYEHFSVNHSDGVYALGSIHVNGCESFNWHLKTFLRNKRGVSRDKLSFYAFSASAFVRIYAEKPFRACCWLLATTSNEMHSY